LLAAAVACSAFAVINLGALRAAVMLAVVSIITSIILFLLGAPQAAIAELIICAGLATVIFMSIIGPDKTPVSPKKLEALKRCIALPLFVLVCLVSFYMLTFDHITFIPALEPRFSPDSKDVLWHFRHIDLIGQAIILLTGIFGVAVLLKKSEGEK